MNQEVISDWYREYSVELYRFALTIVGSEHTAEDVLQDTFIKALRSSDRSFKDGKERAWLYRIARNSCYDILRKQKREVLRGTILDDSQSDVIVDHDAALEFVEMISCLKEIDKTIVSLRIIGGLSHKEIAKIMKMTVHGAKKRYERAIHKLRTEFEEASV